MSYRQGFLEVTPEVRSVPLGVKRKRGRPKKVGHCLNRSPQGSLAPDMLEPASAESTSAEPAPAEPASTEPTSPEPASAEPPALEPASPEPTSPELPPPKKRKVARQWGEPRPEGLRRSKRSKK